MILLAIAYFPTSTEGTTEFPLILRFSNENVKCVFVDCRQNISATKSKQTSSFLEIHNSEQIEFRVSAYLFKFIDHWAPRNVARAPHFYPWFKFIFLCFGVW